MTVASYCALSILLGHSVTICGIISETLCVCRRVAEDGFILCLVLHPTYEYSLVQRWMRETEERRDRGGHRDDAQCQVP